MLEFISLDEAIDIIALHTMEAQVEEVALRDAAGRVLASDITSHIDVPPCDCAAMDGYAICVEKSKYKERLKIIGESLAGHPFKGSLGSGEGVRITTGAVVPRGADLVVPKECCRTTDGELFVDWDAVEDTSGANIRRAGEDLRKGSTIAKRGDLIGVWEMGVLAAAGRSLVPVFKRPKVSIISTGDEIVEVGEIIPEGTGCVYNANAYTIWMLTLKFGGNPFYKGIVKDSKSEIKEVVLSLLDSDYIIATGGASVGNTDFVRDAVMEVGFDVKFWKVRVKPGKPLIFGTMGRTLFFGLPGYPVSAIVSFLNFVVPSLYKCMGREIKTLIATADSNLANRGDRDLAILGRLYEREGRGLFFNPSVGQRSGSLSSVVKGSNAIVIVPPGGAIKVGEQVSVKYFGVLSCEGGLGN